ncbi:unnamed protein product [Diamesa serratosioi]
MVGNKFLICLLILCIFLLKTTFCQDDTEDSSERPYFRILAPKFICNDKKSNQSEPPTSNKLTISLQTREGQKLRYDIKIDFVMLDGFQNQRHTLSIWKNIRMMQSRFVNISDEISLKNQIDIDAVELTPQVIYTFTIVGFDEKNQPSETENFTITYKGGEIKTIRSDLGDGVSLLLFGSEFLYDDAEFLAVAEVTFCEPFHNYYFRWNVSGLSSDIYKNYFDVKSNYLQLPAGTLTPGKSYELSVVMFNNESLTLGSSKMNFKIIPRDFQVVISPSDCMIGINRPIKFYAQIFRFSESIQNIEVMWICSQHGESDCSSNFGNSSNMIDPSITFPTEGDYELQVQVTINNITKTSISKVQINAQVIPHVQIKNYPKLPVDVINQNEFYFTIMDLIPNCVAIWNAKEDESFATYESSNGTEDVFGSIIARDVEEQFLNELVDYDNNTLTKDITLTIPKNTLNSNERYKFSLTISCPEPLAEGAQNTIRQNVTSFYDIVLETNGAPETYPLEIYPMLGIPMKTSFKFSTGAAKDSSADFPLKYKFGYNVENLKIIVGEYYENMVTHSELPYADAIETFFEVCDNNNACARVSGSKVVVNAPYTYSKDEIDFKVGEFESKLKRSEYSGALNVGVVVLVTLKKVLKDSSAIESTILKIMKTQLSTLKSGSDSGYLYDQRVIGFITMSKDLLSIMTNPDDSLVEELLTLSETVNKSARSTLVKRDTLNSLKKNQRITTPDFKNNILSLSEILLSSKNITTVEREKGKYVLKIHQYIALMCQQENFGFFRNDSKFASFEIVKIFSRQLSSEPLVMPGSIPISIQVLTSSTFPAKFVCIGKIRFTIDFFEIKSDDKRSTYETVIYEDSGDGKFELIKMKTLGESFITKVPIESKDTTKCSVWDGSQWNADNCKKQTTNNTNQINFKCITNDLPITIKCDGSSFLVEQIQASTAKPIDTVTSTTVVKSEVTQSTILSPQTDSVTSASTTILSTTALTTTFVPITFIQTTLASTLKTETYINITTPLTSMTTAVSTQSSTTQISTTSMLTLPSTALTTSTSKAMPSEATTPINKLPTTTTLLPEVSTLTATVSTLETISSNNETEKIASNSTEVSAKIEDQQDASISWTLIILLLFFMVMILVLFLFHKYRSRTETADDFPMRSPSNVVRYAKFHDEFIMQ